MLTRRTGMLIAALTLGVTLSAEAAPQTGLNLLIIQTDEHHFNTLGCYGGRIVQTPNIDWIGENGAICTSFYATTPVCSPSRAAFVSGLYPQKTPVVTNNIPLDDAITTFADVLHKRGYATGFAGKWHLDGSGKPQWAPKRKFGFQDNRFMFNRGHWKQLTETPNGPRVGSRNAKGGPNYGLNGADERTYTTDWLCDRAMDFIQQQGSQPFCYMVSLPDPHGPNTVRPPYDTMYSDIQVPIPSTLRRSPKQIPKWGKPAGVTAKQLRKLMIQYYGMVKCIDDNVGQILDTLRKQNILERTIVVFTSDHGDLCGEHGRLNKGVPYEGSARVPFLIYCPKKIPAGTVVSQALSCVDFFPTVLALMDIPHERPVDGRDASRLLTGKAPPWDDVAFVRSTPKSFWLSAVTARYKLVYSSTDQPWLIDLKQDPQELNNLFGQKQHAALIRDLTTKLSAYGRRHQDPYVEHPRIQSWMRQAANLK